MANETLSSFLAVQPSIQTVILADIGTFLNICMTPPVNIFLAAAVLAVGIRYGMRILKGTKNVA